MYWSQSQNAIKRKNVKHLIVGGGVAANRYLRERLQKSANQNDYELVIAPPEWCTDNAVMGALALEKMRRGEFASLDLDITPGLQRGF